MSHSDGQAPQLPTPNSLAFRRNTAASMSTIAADLFRRTEQRRAEREGGPPDPVRNYSYALDDPKANRWARLWNGTWREWNIWRESILTIARELRGQQRRNDLRGEDRLQGNDLLVLEALLSFMNPATAELYPKKDRIAAQAGVHVDTVNESLKRWWRLGFIRWVRRKKPAPTKGEAGPQWLQTSSGYYFELKHLAQDVWHDLWAMVRRRLKGAAEAALERAQALAIAVPALPAGRDLAGDAPAYLAERGSENPARRGR